MTHRQPTTHRRDLGMTLTEILVVIFIISILMGLILGGVAKIQQGAKETHARALLAGLHGCSGMYETATKYQVDHLAKEDYSPYDTIDWTTNKRQNVQGFTQSVEITGSDIADEANDFDDYTDGDGSYSTDMNDTDMKQANLYIERFIWAANQMPAVRKILPSLGAGFGDIDLNNSNVPTGDGFLEVIDPWGNPVAYASRVSHKDDRTLVNNGNDDDFLPEHDSPFFASAGQDQRWGRPEKRGDFNSDSAWEDYKDSDAYRFTLDNLYSFDMDRSATTRGE